METVSLAALTVPRFCFGTLPLSPIQGHREPEKAAALLCEAFCLGLSFLDTAQLYDNYAVIRRALDLYEREGGERERIVVASKSYAYTAAGALRAVEEARRALDRDVIDIFLLHEQESEHTLRGHKDALDALWRLKEQGILRAVGLSTHHVAGVRAAVAAGLDVVHPILNLRGLGIADGTREDMEKAVAEARDAGVGVYLMKVFGGGNLHREAGDCLRYALSLGTCLALGMRDREELRANLHFLSHGTWPEAALSRPRSLHIAAWCTGCGRCVEACASSALRIEEGKLRCDSSLCVLCGYCGARCPDFCLKIV